jgi:AraC family transcriptional regulator
LPGATQRVKAPLEFRRILPKAEPRRYACPKREEFLSASEIFVREAGGGGSVSYSHHRMRFSSADAPWRDLMRLERCVKALEGTEVDLLWTGFGLIRSEGALDYRFDGEPMRSARLKRGDLWIYPQGATVYVSMPLPVELTSLQIAPEIVTAVANELQCPPRVIGQGLRRADEVNMIVSRLEAELQAGCPGGRLFGEQLAYALAGRLVSRDSAASFSSQEPALHGRKLAAVLDYIHAHPTEELDLGHLARLARLSPFHFSRLFKRATGLTPHQYVLRWRVEESKRLLRHSDMEIADIAQRLRFSDQSHFTALFRKLTGATPRRWRDVPRIPRGD